MMKTDAFGGVLVIFHVLGFGQGASSSSL